MKIGDLVTFKIEKDNPQAFGVVTKVDTQTKTSSVTYNVWVAWNFMNGDVGHQFSYELMVLNESR